MSKKLNPRLFAEKHIDKENFNKVEIVGVGLFRSGYSVEAIASEYRLSVSETLSCMTGLDVEDIEYLLEMNWMPFVIADLHSKKEQTELIRECEGIENAWTELMTRHTND